MSFQPTSNKLALRLLVSIAARATLAYLAATSFAQTESITKLKSLSIEEIMDIKVPTVFGAAKHTQSISDAPASVSIVTREDIQIYGYRTFAEILRSVRDFYVTDDRNYGYIGVRGFNVPGDFGGRVLLLVDGHRINEPTYNSLGVLNDFQVDVDIIERVEVIRGAGSALYGSNAFFAVINVITRQGADVRGGEVSSEVRSYDTHKHRFSYGKTFDSGLSLLLTGSIGESRGEDLYYREFDHPETNRGVTTGRDDDLWSSGGLTLSYKEFTLQASYSRREKEVPTATYGSVFNHPGAFTLDERAFVRLAYNREFDNGVSVRADVYWDHYFYEGEYPYDYGEPSATIYRDQSSAKWWGAEVQVSKEFFNSHRLTLGAEVRHFYDLQFDSFDVKPFFSYLSKPFSDSTFGIFLQDEWKISKTLSLNAGIRYDRFEDFGETVNPRLALIYRPTPKTTVKLLYGEAFRAPNAFESVYNTGDYIVNPNLQPEEITSYELVLEQVLTPSLSVNVSLFNNHLSDLISEIYDATTETYTFRNVAQAETLGGSIELEARLPKGIKARISYTNQETVDEMTNRRLLNSPEHLGKLNISMPLYQDKVYAGFELQYSSAVDNIRQVSTDGYALANFTLFSRELVKGWEASASVYNLFDQDYGYPGGPEHVQESVQQNGRNFRVKLTYRF